MYRKILIFKWEISNKTYYVFRYSIKINFFYIRSHGMIAEAGSYRRYACLLQGYFRHFAETYLMSPPDVFFIHLVCFSLFSFSCVFLISLFCFLQCLKEIKRGLIIIEFYWICYCCVLPLPTTSSMVFCEISTFRWMIQLLHSILIIPTSKKKLKWKKKIEEQKRQ